MKDIQQIREGWFSRQRISSCSPISEKDLVSLRSGDIIEVHDDSYAVVGVDFVGHSLAVVSVPTSPRSLSNWMPNQVPLEKLPFSDLQDLGTKFMSHSSSVEWKLKRISLRYID